MAEGSKMLDHFKKVGSRFAFELGVEVFHDEIIKGFRKFLAGYTPDDIPRMVENSEFPYVDPQDFEEVRGLEKYIVKIDTGRLSEAIVEARPDLAEALVLQGEKAGIYLHKLREHFLAILLHPEKALEHTQTVIEAPKRKMKLLTCDTCHQSWPVPEDEVHLVTECPFCHTGRDQPAPSGS